MAFDPEAGQDGRYYRHTPYAEEDMELFMQAMGRAEQFFHFRQPDTGCQCVTGAAYWISTLNEYMDQGRDLPIIVLLLLLLTNLKSIVFDFNYSISDLTALGYLSEGQGIDLLKRQIEVRIINISSKDVEDYIRREISCDLSFRGFHNDIPGNMVPENCLSFDLRVWGSNVDGTLAIK